MGSRRTIRLPPGVSMIAFAEAMQKRMDSLAGKDININGTEFHVSKANNGILLKPEGWNEAVKESEGKCGPGYHWVSGFSRIANSYDNKHWVMGHCARNPKRRR